MIYLCAMTTKRILETSQSAVVDDVRPDGTYLVKLIDEGRGTSGTYSRELLESYGDVFNGVQSFGRHLKDGQEPWERDVKEIAGVIVGETFTKLDDDGKLGLYGYYKPTAEYAPLLEDKDIRSKIGLSIFTEGSYADNSDEIVEFDRSFPFTSVDLVIKAGRGGKFAESAQVSGDIEPSVDKEEGKDAPVALTIEDIKSALAEFGKTLVAEIKDAIKPESNDMTDDPKPDVAEALESAFAAGLTKEQRAVVVESIKDGKNVDEVIASQKALIESVRQALAAEDVAGVVTGNTSVTEGFKGYGKGH